LTGVSAVRDSGPATLSLQARGATIARAMKTVFISESSFDQRSFAEFVASISGQDPNKYELIGGKIVMNPPAGWPYGEAELGIGSILYARVKGRRLGIATGPSQGYELPTGDTVAPEASVILNERLQRGPTPEVGKFLLIVPNLAVEVVSPDSARRDRVEKKAAYAASGVNEYWLVDCLKKTVTVFHLLADGTYDAGEIFRAGERIRSRVLLDLNAPVDDLIPRLPE